MQDTRRGEQPICQFCGECMGTHETVVCAACLTPHHRECFEENGRCTTYACGSREFVECVVNGAAFVPSGNTGRTVVERTEVVPCLRRTAAGLELATDYSFSGFVLLVIGLALVVPWFVKTVPGAENLLDLAWPTFFHSMQNILGLAIGCLSLLPLGTSQRLTFHEKRGVLTYSSRVCFLPSHRQSYRSEDIARVTYEFEREEHVSYDEDGRPYVHYTEAGHVLLSFHDGHEVCLFSTSHSGEIREAVKTIAESMGVTFERRRRGCEQRPVL